MTKPGLPLIERFEAYLTKGPSCWQWAGRLGRGGYGRFSVRHGDVRDAHRLAYQLYVGEIPPGQWVLHRCDNPLCVNPAHLFLGDRAANMRDAYEKGRIDLRYVASRPRPGRRKVAA